MYRLLEFYMLCDCVTRGCGDHFPLTIAAILEWRRRSAWGRAVAARRWPGEEESQVGLVLPEDVRPSEAETMILPLLEIVGKYICVWKLELDIYCFLELPVIGIGLCDCVCDRKRSGISSLPFFPWLIKFLRPSDTTRWCIEKRQPSRSAS